MKRLLIALALAIPVAAHAANGNPDDYVRYLIPVVQRDLRGANGSIWTTELKFRNSRSTPIGLIGALCPPLIDPCPQEWVVLPGNTVLLQPQSRGDGADGAFLYVPKGGPAPLITAHVRDTSKNATSFGTEVHLPLADEFQPQLDLIGVPSEARYRATLRVYGTSGAPQRARVRVYTEANNVLISDDNVVLSGILTFAPDPLPLHPAYAQLDALSDSARASGGAIRISVDTLDEGGFPIWAFVTVTDNVTQLTSTITPNRW